MKIITSNPVFSNCQGETKLTPVSTYSSAEGIPVMQTTKLFQKWANDNKKTGLLVDGKMGTLSATAWKQYGDEFMSKVYSNDELKKSFYEASKNDSNSPAGKDILAINAARESQKENKIINPQTTLKTETEKSGGLKDKWNSYGTGKKIIIVLGAIWAIELIYRFGIKKMIQKK